MSSPFDPSTHLTQLRGRGGTSEYLEVKWRLVWLRREHPDAAIETRVLEHDRQAGYALVQATASIPGGGSASGHGDEERQHFQDYLCKAETKAIGRALAALGYGTQFAGDELDEDDRPADAPVDRAQRQPTRAREARGGGSAGTDTSAPAPAPAAARAPQPPTPRNAAGGALPPAATPAAEPEGSKAYRALVTWAWTLVEDGKSIAEVEAFLNDKGGALSDDEFRLAQREFRAMRARIRQRDAAAERQLAGAAS